MLQSKAVRESGTSAHTSTFPVEIERQIRLINVKFEDAGTADLKQLERHSSKPCSASSLPLFSAGMRHRKWISALDLDKWADRSDAKTRLPELIRRLIHATVDPSDIEHVSFSGGEETHRPGYDGETKVRPRRGNAKLPDGVGYWEIGADGGIKAKLDGDYAKRIEKRGDGDFSGVTYIAITPRDYQKKNEWMADKNALAEWREVRVYDSDDLEQWLEMAPGVALWLARHVTTPPEGMVDLSTHWENVQARLKRALPASVPLVSRTGAVESFKQWLSQSASVLAVQGQSPQEVVDVFTAWAASLPEAEQAAIASRAIIVETADAWRELVDSGQRLILIRAERLELDDELVAEAKRKGHHVLLPVSSIRSKRDEVVRLERMDRYDLEKALREAGLTEQEAYSLAQHSGGSFTVLKRGFSSAASDKLPDWGKAAAAEELAPLLLAGAWREDCPTDQIAISKIAACSYPDARKVVTRWKSVADAPVRWGEGVWEFISLLDAWSFLSPSLSPDHLDAWEAVACEVLGIDDPRLELPPEERWQANIKGKNLAHSRQLQKGLVRTLVLLATRESSDEISDTISLTTRVNRIVRAILPENSSWQRWASLGSLLPLVAEAAPDVFLEAVESALRGNEPELPKLFAQERSGITGRAEHTGLLWALERLAWSPQLLPRVSLVLAKLAEHDPGGQWANRPDGSLRDIFFSWMPHTAASLDQRLEVLQLILERNAEVGWRLLLALLPHGNEFITNHSTPEWRFWAERWERGVTRSDYGRTIKELVAKALAIAANTPARWLDFIKHLPSFPHAEFLNALDQLDRLSASCLPIALKQTLWVAVRDLAQQHRFFADAEWALPDEDVLRLETVRDKLQPDDPVELAIPFFKRGFDRHGSKEMTWEEQERLRAERRTEAVRTILHRYGFDGAIRLVRTVDDPSAVGVAIATATVDEHQSCILPDLLNSVESAIAEFAAAYAGSRIYSEGRDWAENLPVAEWQAEQAAAFAIRMPFDRQTWDFARRMGEDVEKRYWQRTWVYGRGLTSEDIERAARALLNVGRPAGAIELLTLTLNEPGSPTPATLFDLLESALASPANDEKRKIDTYEIQMVLEKLQQAEGLDETRLARLEWNLLPILDRHSLLPATLHKLLAREPTFFIELLTTLFRPRHRGEESEMTDDEPEPDEAKRRHAERAWRLLHEWRLVPGTEVDGTVNAQCLREWVISAREKAAAVDRLEVCDITLGELFAKAPGEPDGTWPCIAVRDVLEITDSPEMGRGLSVGIFNKRGAYSKGLREGGKQERDLAATYEAHANACQNRWPRIAAVLLRVAGDYSEEAKREDKRAGVED